MRNSFVYSGDTSHTSESSISGRADVSAGMSTGSSQKRSIFVSNRIPILAGSEKRDVSITWAAWTRVVRPIHSEDWLPWEYGRIPSPSEDTRCFHGVFILNYERDRSRITESNTLKTALFSCSFSFFQRHDDTVDFRKWNISFRILSPKFFEIIEERRSWITRKEFPYSGWYFQERAFYPFDLLYQKWGKLVQFHVTDYNESVLYVKYLPLQSPTKCNFYFLYRSNSAYIYKLVYDQMKNTDSCMRT